MMISDLQSAVSPSSSAESRADRVFSMEYPEIIGRQGPDKDIVPRQFQRMHVYASEDG
jgi:hypothetical protein